MTVLDFTGKRIVVAGVGGIGSAVVHVLHNLGAELILVDVSKESVDKVCGEIGCAAGYECDFSDVASIEPLIGRIVSNHGIIDGLVFAVGTGAVRPLKMTKYDFMIKVMNINFLSFVELVRTLTLRGKANPDGMNIVGVSALGAFLGNATKTAYCASKGAMNAAVRCMAKELASKNIRVNTVAPGVTDTPMLHAAAEYGVGSEAFRQILDRQYLGVCQPEDIANAVAFLMSPLSGKITGCCLPVDGGKLTS